MQKLYRGCYQWHTHLLGIEIHTTLNLNNIFLPTPLVMSIRDSKTEEGRDFDNPEVKAWLKRQRKMEVK